LITFREFAATSTTVIHLAEEAARLAFQNLPEHLVASMHGALVPQNLGFECEHHGYKTQMEAIQTQLNEMGNLLCIVAGSKRIKKAHSTCFPCRYLPLNQQTPSDLSNGSISTSSWAVEDTSQITSSKSPPC
jgi:hypothetical protein